MLELNSVLKECEGVMIELSKDIDSLSNFKRKTPDFVARMKKTGSPLVLTINGKAELVVQDAESYQRLLALADRVESLEFLRRSFADADAGRTRHFRKAVQSLGRKR
jgi:PHD/YefM family antitoxin component YafN of YafNO toxin-antitoxin module